MPEAARARSSGEPGPVLERSRCRRCFPLCRWALPSGARPLPSLGTVRLRGPDRGGFRWGGDDAPSARKPSLAIREGALGYRSPQPSPLLERDR